MSKQPKLMSIPRMRDILEPCHSDLSQHVYIDSQLVIIHGSAEFFQFIIRQDPPFIINDRRLGIITAGEARININLVEKHLTAGMLVYIGPGSIISPVSLSPDLEIFGFGIPTDFPLPLATAQLPQAFNGQQRDFQLAAPAGHATTARHILSTLWHMVHQPSYNLASVAHLIAAQMFLYDDLFSQQAHTRQGTQPRQQALFDRFIYLAGQHAPRHRQLSFYARKMCLTERYLSTAVRQATGTTAKAWIDRALINRIKAELRHSDKTIAQITDEMNFPNPSFFCKFFKRLTGMTPTEFRNN